MIKRSLIVGTALLLHFSIQAGTTNTYAGDMAGADASANPTITNAAAIVDGHIIPMEDVALRCLRENREFIIGQMIQVYVLDRECQKRGITVSEFGLPERCGNLPVSSAVFRAGGQS